MICCRIFYTCIGVYKIVTECSPEVIMTYNCNIFFNYFVRIAGEYHITTMFKMTGPFPYMYLCTAAGRANRPWGRVLHLTIGANDPVLSKASAKSGRSLQLNAARRINRIRHVAGNTSPGFAYQDEECILQILWTAA